ncbi:GMP synthase, partial [Coprinellus micaceus]
MAIGIHDQFETILILDFGSQYSHLITRRCREHKVYAELLPCTTKIADIDFKPKGIILSGSPYSVYDKDSPHVDPAVFELGVPILGICYGLQEIAWNLGGEVTKCDHREYGFAKVQVWMSHGDQLSRPPADFHVVGHTDTAPYAALAHNSKPIYGIQFHPEVTHSVRGKEVIGRFILDICKCTPNWTMVGILPILPLMEREEFIGKEIARIREICGPKGRVIGAVSGGVDSTVAAKLMHEAIGDRFHAIMVDNGVLRMNEADQVYEMLNKNLGVNLTVVDSSDRFLTKLDGVEDPEQKRKIIGNTFIHVFEEEAAKIEAAAEAEEKKGADPKGRVEWLLQGTLYPDMRFVPLAAFSTSPPLLSSVTPFPGPGLAIRILGPVTREQVKILQQADKIYIEEIRNAGLYDQISQAFAVLLPVKAVGVMGDARTYEQVIALRAVQSEDFMTADWFVFPAPILKKISSRITNEVAGINRVTYDISSKPPA